MEQFKTPTLMETDLPLSKKTKADTFVFGFRMYLPKNQVRLLQINILVVY